MKRTMIILLVVLLSISMAVPAAATTEENIIQPKWSYFTAITAKQIHIRNGIAKEVCRLL